MSMSPVFDALIHIGFIFSLLVALLFTWSEDDQRRRPWWGGDPELLVIVSWVLVCSVLIALH